MAILEPQANGIPCVGLSEKGIPDLIKDGINGFVVPNHDPPAFAHAVMRILGDEELARTLRAGTLREVKNHSLGEVIRLSGKDLCAADRGQVLMEKTFEVLNRLVSDGIIGRYAVGGAMGAMFYTEPVSTFRLGYFRYPAAIRVPGLLTLGPLYEHLRSLHYDADGEFISIEGVPVQFLPAYNALVEEGLIHSTIQIMGRLPLVCYPLNTSLPSRFKRAGTRTAFASVCSWKKRKSIFSSSTIFSSAIP